MFYVCTDLAYVSNACMLGVSGAVTRRDPHFILVYLQIWFYSSVLLCDTLSFAKVQKLQQIPAIYW